MSQPYDLRYLGANEVTFAQGGPASLQSPRANVGQAKVITRGSTQAVIDTVQIGGSEMFTLTLVRRDQEDGVASLVDDVGAFLRADISFGAGGCVEQVSVDWLNGVLITIPAGSLQVRCAYPEDAVLTEPLQQYVGCIVTPRPRGGAAGQMPQARLTSRLGSVVAGATPTIVACPARAHAVRLVTRRPDLYGSFRLGFSPTLKNGDEYYFADPADADEIPLGSGVRAVTVENNAVAVNVVLSLIWSIAL